MKNVFEYEYIVTLIFTFKKHVRLKNNIVGPLSGILLIQRLVNKSDLTGIRKGSIYLSAYSEEIALSYSRPIAVVLLDFSLKKEART